MVVDASLAATWFLPDENSEAAERIMTSLLSAPAHAPSLFWSEMRNLLLVAERRGRLPPGDATLAMARLRKLAILDDGVGSDGLILAIAARNGLSAYDATYLALAAETSRPLATLDARMARAGREEGVTILGPLAGPS